MELHDVVCILEGPFSFFDVVVVLCVSVKSHDLQSDASLAYIEDKSLAKKILYRLVLVLETARGPSHQAVQMVQSFNIRGITTCHSQ
jgi:hypothetical protein